MAIHIPYPLTWAHEHVDEDHGRDVIHPGRISELPDWLAKRSNF